MYCGKICGGKYESFKEITRKEAMRHCGTTSYCDSCGCERSMLSESPRVPCANSACASLLRLSREPRQPISSRKIPKSVNLCCDSARSSPEILFTGLDTSSLSYRYNSRYEIGISFNLLRELVLDHSLKSNDAVF